MIPYSLIKNFLFLLPPEMSHTFALESLRLSHSFSFKKASPTHTTPLHIMGLEFPNSIGLAAGLDKNGDYIDALGALGFGFIEVGTVTPKPQAGNPKPRLFRLKAEEALINRMGFNNKGIDHLIERLKKTRYQGILGINIGKNKETSLDQAIEDYLFGFKKLAPFASYITINISSPNTPSLRDLQQEDLLRELVKALKTEQAKQPRYVPLVVKIAPDLSTPQLEEMADIFLAEKIDGIIATNTTLSREGVANSPYKNENGGLSGLPLKQKATHILQQLHFLLKNKIPIIGCGGIASREDAQQKFAAGASLLQIYTGLIYQGPRLIQTLVCDPH
jgi:dihydroorotate dehydrogenase